MKIVHHTVHTGRSPVLIRKVFFVALINLKSHFSSRLSPTNFAIGFFEIEYIELNLDLKRLSYGPASTSPSSFDIDK